MTEQVAYERIVNALRQHGSKVAERGNQASAQCPAHEDRNPSLRVTAIEGQSLVYCHGGCDTKDVLAALGLDMRDLYDAPRGQEVARYQYTDAAGRPTRIVHRYWKDGGKDFTQSGDKTLVQLYRLPRVIEAVAAGLTVFLVEGEKDVHAIEALSAVATTAPQGGGNFDKVDVSPLKGATVIAIADKDATGETWAKTVRRRLDRYAAKLLFREAKEGKDAADHIAAGYSLGELVPIEFGDQVGAEEEQKPDLLAGLRTGDWLDAQDFPEVRYAVPGILPEGSSLLVGPPKIGKSWAVLNLLLAIASGGRAFGGIEVGEKRPVLYLALEDGDRRLQDRCRKLLAGEPIPKLFNYMITVPPGRVLDVIAEWSDRNPDAAAIVLDTLGKVMPPAAVGESSYQRDYRIGGWLKRLADQRPGLALLTNHHDRKAESSDFVDSVSGTHGLAGAADTILVLTRQRHEADGLLKVTGRDVAEGEYALSFSEDCAWQIAGGNLDAAAEKARTARLAAGLGDKSAAIATFVASHPEGVRAGDVGKALGMDAKQAGTYLGRLADSGKVDKYGRGMYGPADTPVGSVESVESTDTDSTVTTLSTRSQRGDPFPHWAAGAYDREAG